MAKAIKVNLVIAGFNEIRTSEKAKDLTRARAEEVARRAGSGFEVVAAHGSARARFIVRAATSAAKRAEATNKVLSKALGVGGG